MKISRNTVVASLMLLLGVTLISGQLEAQAPSNEEASLPSVTIPDRNGVPLEINALLEDSSNPRKELIEISKLRDDLSMVFSIDANLQQLIYKTLSGHVESHNASSGSVVVLEVNSGEVLALANYPSAYPNNPFSAYSTQPENRAVMEWLEPGSTMKPFTIAAALDAGVVATDTVVDTSPGSFKVRKLTVKEHGGNDFGEIDLSDVIEKSSNVGAAKVALMLKPEQHWRILDLAGVGELTGSNMQGEVAGVLRDYEVWTEVEQAIHSYGYGMSMTPLQLARSYLSFANNGMIRDLSLLHGYEGNNKERPRRVFSEETARTVRLMMERAVTNGHNTLAKVEGVRVAGMSGTVDKLVGGRYKNNEGKPFGYMALFAGMAPVDKPEVVAVVVIDNPKGEKHTGGEVAAPLFSEVMTEALKAYP